MIRNARTAYLVLAWLLVVALLVQFVLGGQAVFQDAGRSALHVTLGYAIGLAIVVMTILASMAKMPRFARGSAILLGLFIIQFLLIALRSNLPVAAAFHPLNGALILGLAVYLAWRARSMAPPPLGTRKDL